MALKQLVMGTFCNVNSHAQTCNSQLGMVRPYLEQSYCFCHHCPHSCAYYGNIESELASYLTVFLLYTFTTIPTLYQ